MSTRAETAAATRRALLGAAAELLDEGGPDAVTLRAVGARAGVSRGAPYGHFDTKDDLLTVLAVNGWLRVEEALEQLPREGGAARLRVVLGMVLDLARRQPHLYALMFTTPAGDPAPLVRAASAVQDLFLAVVAESVADRVDPRPVGALLMSAAHGVAGMELAGQLGTGKWNATADELIDLMVQTVTGANLQ